MPGARLAPLLGLWSLVLLATAAPADAALKPISGKLTERNHTVIALAPNGKATVARARRGRFRLRPPARSVTLQLRSPDGSYAGPVVVGGGRRTAIVGVRPGTRLGTVRVRRGYASVSRRLGARRIDTRLRARARRGVPIGAGRFGRVRSASVRDGAPGDEDLDGIPDVLDVDDDGDLVLDGVDVANAGRRGRLSQDPGEQFGFHSRLTLYLDTTANANATSLGTQQVDAAMAASGDLLLGVLPSDPLPDSPELDCGGSIQQPPRPEGLVYCRRHSVGGTGEVGRYPPTSLAVPFPDCCDADGDGLGKLTADTGPLAMTLHHGATTSQIGTGDVMVQTVTRNGVKTSFLAALQYVLATVPALVAYDEDGPGGAAPIQVTYPFPGPGPGGTGGGPGLRGNPAVVGDGPDADTDAELTVTFWRPQRRAVPAWNEPGDWIDIGGLHYEVQVRESGRRCPQDAFTEDHPELASNGPSAMNPGLTDLAGDRPADAANTFTYTLNLTRCMEANGFSFDTGDEGAFSFLATNPNGPDNSQQTVFFKRG